MFSVNDSLKCVNSSPLEGNSIAPPLVLEQQYPAKEVYVCKCGEQHIDVGLSSAYNTMTCYKCREELPRGSKIHWCNSIRFEVVS